LSDQAHNLKVAGSNPAPATKPEEKQAIEIQEFFLCLSFEFDHQNHLVKA